MREVYQIAQGDINGFKGEMIALLGPKMFEKCHFSHIFIHYSAVLWCFGGILVLLVSVIKYLIL